MTSAAQLLREGRTTEIWQRYCGWIELSLEEFMHIQKRLLLEQIELLNGCQLGQRLLGAGPVTSVESFQRCAPLTTYHDYLPFLPERQEHMLPAKPVAWVRTSGRTGEFGCKWVPLPRQGYENLGRHFLGTLIMASARTRGEVRLEEDDIYLYTVAPPPFISGSIMHAGRDEFPFRFVPSVEEAEAMDFQERMGKAFLTAMETGVDYFLGIASVLLTMGESFSKRSGQMRPSRELLKPAALWRLGKAAATSKLRNEPLAPRHIWKPKGITTGGMDVQTYRKRIEQLWGVKVLEGYGCTEFGTVGMQGMGAQTAGMVLTPDSAFWEFMTEEDYARWRADRSYQPQTKMLDEVAPGKYVIIGTSLLGGAFVRYVLGDLVRVLPDRSPECGITLPQIVVESRADDLIDLSSLVWLTERSLWQAFAKLDLGSTEWIARKEISPSEGPVVHIYLENGHYKTGELASAMHDALIETMEDYKSYFGIMNRNPVRVSSLAPGTFRGYMLQKQAEGAELGHLKPPCMQPKDEIVRQLLAISSKNGGENSQGLA